MIVERTSDSLRFKEGVNNVCFLGKTGEAILIHDWSLVLLSKFPTLTFSCTLAPIGCLSVMVFLRGEKLIKKINQQSQ